MNAIPDKFAQWDAAYVLGGLSPAERREFEEHLASCPPCQAAVSELAALPGLLAQISPADAAMLSLADDSAGYAETSELGAAQADVIDQGPPPSLLPKMIKTVRTRRRRVVAAAAGIAAAGEVANAAITLADHNFRHWDSSAHTWTIEPGTYQLQAGHSVVDLPLTSEISRG